MYCKSWLYDAPGLCLLHGSESDLLYCINIFTPLSLNSIIYICVCVYVGEC